MGILTSSAIMAALAVTVTSAILAGLVVVEHAAPRGRYPLASRLRGATFWAIYVPLSAVVLTMLSALWRRTGLAPLVAIDLSARFAWAGPAAPLLSGFSVILATDFVTYWFHRIQHRLLWRFHAVHHAIGEMHAVGSYDHPADILFGFLLVAVPLSLVSFRGGGEGVVLQLLLAVHLKFTHASTRLHLGPLRRLLVDNRYHRIHHSAEPRHAGKNFGSITTIWDQLFGTAYFPARDEWPQTGLSYVAEPRCVREFLDLPFRLPAGRRAAAETRPPAAAGPPKAIVLRPA